MRAGFSRCRSTVSVQHTRLAKALDSYGRAVGDRLGEADTLAAQGQVSLVKGDSAQAEALLEQALAIYHAIGDRYNQAAVFGIHGFALLLADKPQAARPYLLKTADSFEAMGMADFTQIC